MSTALQEASDDAALLRAAGLRVTRPRLGVLAALREHPHADAADVLTAVRADQPTVSHQAVYDSLHTLTEAHLVRSLQPAGSTARYELNAHDNHHHLVCRGCGKTVEITAPDVEDWAQQVAREHGFAEPAHTVEITGLCAECSAA